jgi:hypothetical protein
MILHGWQQLAVVVDVSKCINVSVNVVFHVHL